MQQVLLQVASDSPKDPNSATPTPGVFPAPTFALTASRDKANIILASRAAGVTSLGTGEAGHTATGSSGGGQYDSDGSIANLVASVGGLTQTQILDSKAAFSPASVPISALPLFDTKEMDATDDDENVSITSSPPLSPLPQLSFPTAAPIPLVGPVKRPTPLSTPPESPTGRVWTESVSAGVQVECERTDRDVQATPSHTASHAQTDNAVAHAANQVEFKRWQRSVGTSPPPDPPPSVFDAAESARAQAVRLRDCASRVLSSLHHQRHEKERAIHGDDKDTQSTDNTPPAEHEADRASRRVVELENDVAAQTARVRALEKAKNSAEVKIARLKVKAAAAREEAAAAREVAAAAIAANTVATALHAPAHNPSTAQLVQKLRVGRMPNRQGNVTPRVEGTGGSLEESAKEYAVLESIMRHETKLPRLVHLSAFVSPRAARFRVMKDFRNGASGTVQPTVPNPVREMVKLPRLAESHDETHRDDDSADAHSETSSVEIEGEDVAGTDGGHGVMTATTTMQPLAGSGRRMSFGKGGFQRERGGAALKGVDMSMTLSAIFARTVSLLCTLTLPHSQLPSRTARF